MTADIRTRYNVALTQAYGWICVGNRKQAMRALGDAMRCANLVANDPQYRKAVFRVMSFARRIP